MHIHKIAGNGKDNQKTDKKDGEHEKSKEK